MLCFLLAWEAQHEPYRFLHFASNPFHFAARDQQCAKMKEKGWFCRAGKSCLGGYRGG